MLFRKVLKIENWSIACSLALYGSTVHPRCIMWFSGHVFLLSVHASLKKANLNNLIHGGFGGTWGHNFYMGTQNG